MLDIVYDIHLLGISEAACPPTNGFNIHRNGTTNGVSKHSVLPSTSSGTSTMLVRDVEDEKQRPGKRFLGL